MKKTSTKQLVKFDFDLAVISALDAKYKAIKITDGKSYAVVMQGLAEYRELRLRIDTLHKNYKKDILEAGRSLDGDKNRLKALLEPGEDRLKHIRLTWDEEKTAIKEEKDRKERERIENTLDKVNSIRNQGMLIFGTPLHIIEERLTIIKSMEISSEVYMEFTGQAVEAKKAAIVELEHGFTARRQFEQEKAERKAEAERLEKVRKEQEATQAKIDEGARKVREGIAKLEVDRKAAEETKEREEWEKKEKARIHKEMEEAKAKEECERIEKEEADAKEKTRQEALKPDKEKLNNWIQGFNAPGQPLSLKSKEAQEIYRIAWESIEEVLQAAMWKTEKL